MLSLYDYRASQEIAQEDYPFYALIAAAMIKADGDNFKKLSYMWPETARLLQLRYNAPGGLLTPEVEFP